jgi:NADPH:quinone reductase-like Zn-dependent oxidoreductase
MSRASSANQNREYYDAIKDPAARWHNRPLPAVDANRRGERRQAPVKAVRFAEYGGTDVLNVVDVPQPVPGPGQALVRVKAAGINPGEAKIREGLLHSRWPAVFPSGEGTDLAGVVAETGAGVTGFAAGDEVIGFTDNRASHAEFVVVDAEHLTAKPAGVPWEVAGALFVAGATAYAAVRAVDLSAGDTLVVSGAAGGVGSIAVQLAKLAGATVIGLAGEANHGWLREHGVIPVSYGDGAASRIRAAADKVDAFIDTFGADYVQLALDLGVDPSRIDTIVNFNAVQQFGVKAEGSAAGASAAVLAELAGLIAAGKLEIPIAATFPLTEVRAAYDLLAKGHIRGKIVLMI